LSETNPSDAGAPDDAFARAADLQRKADFAGAVEAYREATRHVVTVNAALNMGVCLTELGEFDEAEHWLMLAARYRPADPLIRRLLGNTLGEKGAYDRAELEYRTGLAFAPQDQSCRLALAGVLLKTGRYAEGWPLMEARVELNPDTVPPVKVGFPQWTGQPLGGGSILVWYEQGFGDQIQFARFARDLKARGAGHVAFACRPPLVDLLKTVPGIEEIIPAPRGAVVSIRNYDFWTRYFSLPGALGITLENLPGAPYLAAPADRRARWTGFSGVGLAWRASPTGFNGRNKTLPEALAREILDLGAISLDPEDTGVADFADTAAIIEQLDLVISIDSAVAHLAGAMGKPCWTLLPRLRCDWRWGVGRSDSPWYPSMRLYRQQTVGDWRPLVDDVIRDLAAR
jgi:tetratricopeptide (TPR) repeat protein